MSALVSYKFSLTKPRFETVVPSQGDAFGKSVAAGEHARKELERIGDGVRNQIYTLQKTMADKIASGELQEVEMQLTHTFAPGVYVRTAYLKAGSTAVGKIHKHTHANILSKGDVTVVTEAGGIQHISGFMPMVSEAGTKRAVHAHTDTIWTTIHLTNSTDLAGIEKELIAETYEEYENFLFEGETMKNIEVTS